MDLTNQMELKMSSHCRNYGAGFRTLLFVWLLFPGSTLNAQLEAQLNSHQRYERVPVIGPTTEGDASIALDPPSDEEVIQALEKARPTRGFIPLLYQKHPNNVRIVREKIAEFVDPPRNIPLIGMAKLHHAHYRCTIHFSERSDKDASEVIYIDHNHFHLCGNDPTRATQSPQASQPFHFSMGFERGESLASLKQRYNELEQQTHQLANKLKQSISLSEAERSELQAAVRKSFEARQALQRAELADLAQRMQNMQQSIDLRDKLADKVIERRVEDLLNPNLKWDVTRTSTPNLSQATEQLKPDASRQPIERAIWEIVNQLSLGDNPKLPLGIVLTEIESFPKVQLPDFKEEIREQVVSALETYGHLIVTSRRVAEATLLGLQLKPKDLLLPKQLAQYFEALEKEGQSAQFILLMRWIHDENSTRYLLTLELIDRSGRSYKSSALVSKTGPTQKTPKSEVESTKVESPEWNTPQTVLARIDECNKSGSYDDFIALFSDEGVRDLAGSVLMQAVIQTNIDEATRQFTFGVAEDDPELVAFRKVLQRWLPQSVTTAQQEAMGKGLSTMMSSIGGAAPDQTALKEFVSSIRESVGGIRDHRKFCIDIMRAFEKRTTKKFIFFGNADQENEWQISQFGDRAIATLIDGKPGMATTITLQQANGTWRISSLFNELAIEASLPPKSRAHVDTAVFD